MCELGYDICKHQVIFDTEKEFFQKFYLDNCVRVYEGVPMGFYRWSDEAKEEHMDILKKSSICYNCLKEKLNIK